MGLVPERYTFTKESNGNVTLKGYIGNDIVEIYSLNPKKDIRISQSYPENIVIPVDSIGNHIDNKFIAINWKKVDAQNSTPTGTKTSLFQTLKYLADNFFYL